MTTFIVTVHLGGKELRFPWTTLDQVAACEETATEVLKALGVPAAVVVEKAIIYPGGPKNG